jgi:butyrate kinase
MDYLSIIFTVNPGATSTKCALYKVLDKGIKEITSETINHPDEIITQFETVASQIYYRERLVHQFISSNLPLKGKIIACAGRGGMLTPVPSGVIKVNEELVDFSLNRPVYQHASNLGAPLAYRVAQTYKVDAFIVDPVSVDEFTTIARISGSPDFPRFSFVHALNIRAAVRKLSERLGKKFKEMRCVIAHLGAGFSIAAFDRGKIVDNDNRMESAPFTPERAGGIPPIPLINACFLGKYSKKELMKKLYGEGGVYAYLGTKDMREIEQRVKNGDEFTTLIYDAMIYQICKEIGAMASVINFDIDGIIITGGLAKDRILIERITEKVHKIGNIYIYPGSNENEALAQSVLRALQGVEKFMIWPVKINREEKR